MNQANKPCNDKTKCLWPSYPDNLDCDRYKEWLKQEAEASKQGKPNQNWRPEGLDNPYSHPFRLPDMHGGFGPEMIFDDFIPFEEGVTATLDALRKTGIHLGPDNEPSDIPDEEVDSWIAKVKGPGHIVFIPEDKHD